MDITEAKRFLELNELDKALQILNELNAKNGTDIHSLNLRARIHYKMQNWGNAMNDYTSVLEIDPGNAEAKSGLAMARNILGYFTPDMFNP
jgi:nicotinate-nucleotide adenylyltransferase